jgi:hypothetical protein|tara:strand:+ start:1393 stop:1575 length:183 start_codon:yes stop_codon:yes gene_type:complete
MAKQTKHYKKNGQVHRGSVHRMPNGHLHSGKTHTKSSKRVFHYGELNKTAQATARKSWKK